MAPRSRCRTISLVIAIALGACAQSHPPTLAPPRTTALSAAPTTAAPSGPPDALVAQSNVAHLAVYQRDGGADLKTTLDQPTSTGAPVVLLVTGSSGPWLHVLLPIRPNGSDGWVRASDVSVRADPYRVTVHVGAHRLVVTRGATVVADEPVGVGTTDTPTPGGTYYIKELLQPPDPNGPYGPYAYGLSGFSNVLSSFAGGDGVVGIHGTNDPSTVGRDVSHGCLRLHNEAILKLVPILPLGTPVEIDA